MPYVVERIVAQGRQLNKDRVFIPTGEHLSISLLMLRICSTSVCLGLLIRHSDTTPRLVRLGATSLNPIIHTGFQSKELIVQADLRLGDVDQYPTIDVTIDGADE